MVYSRDSTKKCKRKLKLLYIGYNNIMTHIFYNISYILTKSTKSIPYWIHKDIKQNKGNKYFCKLRSSKLVYDAVLLCF